MKISPSKSLTSKNTIIQIWKCLQTKYKYWKHWTTPMSFVAMMFLKPMPNAILWRNTVLMVICLHIFLKREKYPSPKPHKLSNKSFRVANIWFPKISSTGTSSQQTLSRENKTGKLLILVLLFTLNAISNPSTMLVHPSTCLPNHSLTTCIQSKVIFFRLEFYCSNC